MRRILLLANGPGELWCWARPMIPALTDLGFEVSLRILPCQYSAGNEAQIAGNLGAEDVSPPSSIFGSLARREKKPLSAVFQLGGDLLFGFAFSRRNRVPLFCYTYAFKPLLGRCCTVFTGFEQARHTFRPGCDNVFVAGDLVADSLAMDGGDTPWLSEEGHRVVFFPGSRRAIRSAALPFIREVRDSMDMRLPGIETVTALSPFASPEDVEDWRSAGLNPATASTGSILRGADLAITQPGTNTLELAYSGTPGIVVLPFAFLGHVPLPGLKGAVASIPFAGPFLKGVALRSANRNRGLLAWPNRLAGREVMPEMVGDISSDDVANVAVELLLDERRRKQIISGLEKIVQGPGAARRIAAQIARMLG